MRGRRDRSGAALIIVLAFLGLIAGMVVSLVVGMRFEQQSSYYYLERQRALFLAQQGTAYGQALLEAALPATNTSWWVSQPGFLTFLSVTNGNLSSVTNVALSTGAGDTNRTGAFAPADLNPIGRLDNERVLDPRGTNLFLNWVYVRSDGSLETNQAPASLTNGALPLVGRFAFWVDDESTRININTAWTNSGNPNPPPHPSLVSLGALPGLTADVANAIHNRATNRPFNTPAEAFSVDAGAAAVLSSNRFDLTHYNHDLELTPWGTPKIVLTTQATNLASTNQPYLKILSQPNTDPGLLTNLDNVALLNTLSNIVVQLGRTNWPYTAGQTSLLSKYYPGTTTNRAWQLAADIVDYVRSVESTNPIVQPIIGAAGVWGTNATVGSDGNGFMGAPRRPMITEMGVVFQGPYAQTNSTSTNTLYHTYFYCGFWAPTNSTIDGTTILKFTGEILRAEPPPAGPVSLSGSSVVMGTPALMGTAAGGSLYRARFISSDYTNGPTAAAPTNCFIRMGLQYVGTIANDYAPLYYSYSDITSNSGVLVPIKYANGSTLPDQTAQVSDPRVNKRVQDWKIGTPPLWKTLLPPSDLGTTPLQDHTGAGSSGAVYATASFPAPKGKFGNTNGLVASVGELGFVSTGVECSTNSQYPSVPFRTLRFQPTPGATTNSLPDWVLADIFTVPISTNGGTAVHPYTNAIAGRINLNAALRPFPSLQRTNGLSAAFLGLSLPAATVSNIASATLAANGVAYGGTNGLSSVGALAEIAGVSDTGEASEDLFRSLSARPVTTRGDVFTVYALGQAVKQLPNGNLQVTGQKLTRTMIERYPTNSISGTVTNVLGKFRTLYWRED